MGCFLCSHNDWIDCVGVRALLLAACGSFVKKTLEIVSAIFNPWELAYAILDLDCWLACGPMSKVASIILSYKLVMIVNLGLVLSVYSMQFVKPTCGLLGISIVLNCLE